MRGIAAGFLAFLIVVSVGMPLKAGERYIDFSKEGFRMELPEQWVRVPQDVFQEKMKSLKQAYEQDGSQKRLGYDYALQLQSREWFSYPYMLISIWEDIHVDTEDMSQMNHKIEKSLLQGGNETKLVSSSFDPERHYYRAEARFRIAGEQLVLLKGVYYRNHSVLQLSTYMTQEMYSRYAQKIRKAMGSLKMDPSTRHRAQADSWLDFRDLIPYLKVIIATVLVFLIAGIYVWKQRRGKEE
ncbi:MAG: hypothetical protein K9K39_07945 [Desulfohalobiaceae bacterium]|nr:hypothetical protein [Desulfohalobiaceae bacterium]